MKSRMVRLSTRVETLKEVLQKYLDDDADMKDLNLSAKCAPACGPTPRQACLQACTSSGYSLAFSRLWGHVHFDWGRKN